MQITHDFHVHTHLSLCADKSATAEAYARIFKEAGIKKAGFADHFWDANYENSHAYLLVIIPVRKGFSLSFSPGLLSERRLKAG